MKRISRGREPTAALVAEVCAAIKKSREDRDRTQEDVAATIGVTQETYSRKERGLVPFTLAEIVAVAAALDIPASSLFPDHHVTRASA